MIQEQNNLNPNNFTAPRNNGGTSQNLNSNPPKKRNLGLIIGIVIFMIAVVLIIVIVITSSKKEEKPKEEVSKEEAPKVEQTPITKEEFLEIENQYLQSENIFNIEEGDTGVQVISENGIVIVGTGKKGTFTRNDIVEFVDQYGELRKAPIIATEAFRTEDEFVREGSSAAVMLPPTDKDDFVYTSIIFKNEIYNGIEVSISDSSLEFEEIEKYLNSNPKFDITINGTVENATIVTYYHNRNVNDTRLYLILNSNNVYSVNDEVKINNLNISGEIENLLR